MLVSRDRLTSRIGDSFGSVSQRSRFGEGDPFLPAVIGAIQGGIKIAQAIKRARAGRGGPMAPPSSNLLTKAGSGTGHRAAGRGPFLTSSSRLIREPGMRRHRRMRVTNVKALKRAFRRVKGFARIASQTISFTKRVHMKHRRRRR